MNEMYYVRHNLTLWADIKLTSNIPLFANLPFGGQFDESIGFLLVFDDMDTAKNAYPDSNFSAIRVIGSEDDD